MKRSELLQLIAQDPDFILLDEPDSGVDLENIKLVGDVICQLLGKGKVQNTIRYHAAKSDKRKRFWGLFGHVSKEVLLQAYREAKANDGSAGIDNQTFEDIERYGKEQFIAEISEELRAGTYKPQRSRKVDIKKENGKTRTLGIPTMKDRVVQGAIKQIIEPIFEADFSEYSYGYRPGRNQHQAVTQTAVPIRETPASHPSKPSAGNNKNFISHFQATAPLEKR